MTQFESYDFRSEFFETFKDKIGNCLIFFCQGKKDIPLSTALKLLFKTDEIAVKDCGVPITWLDYNANKRGPVACDVYFEVSRLSQKEKEIKDVKLTLDDFIDAYLGKEDDEIPHVRISPKKEFDDSEFSEYDLKILNKVYSKYGHLSSNKLSSLTHEVGGLWYNVVKKNNLELYFEIKNTQHSHYPVDFIPLLDTEEKKMAYQLAYEALSFQKSF